MPVRKVSVKGKTKYRYGKTGKVYTGAKAKQKATAQGKAIHASGYKGKRKKY